MGETLKRVLMTFLFLPILYLSFLDKSNIIFSVLVFFISLLGFLELYFIFKKKGYFINLWVGIPSIFLIDYLVYIDKTNYLFIVLLVFFIIEVFFSIFGKDFLKSILRLSLGIFSIFYIGIMPASLIVIKKTSYTLLLTIISFTWFCDIGAYFIGKYFGKNKLGLPISPHKTIEGFIGGVVVSVIFGIITSYLLHVELSFYLFFLPFLTIIGDLFESLIKRGFETKDSSHLIPGHGGILDVFDSLIFTGSIIFIINTIGV